MHECSEEASVLTHGLGLRLGGPLVGRHTEQTIVRSALSGSGGVLFLTGEAGIGKTRLATEAMRWARDTGRVVLKGRAVSGTDQYRALREAFMPTFRRTGPPDDPGLTPYRAALSRLLPEWRPGPGSARPAGPDDAPVVLAEGVLRLLVAVGGEPGCVMVLEDLHDADADTLAVVDYLVDNLHGEQALIVATVRSGPSPGMDLARAARHRRAATVADLGPLDDAEVAELAAHRLGVRPAQVPAAALARLHQAADGNPLHVEELLAGMVADSALDSGAAGPPVLEDVLAARAGRLGPRIAHFLSAAALLGRRFPAEVAAEAAGVAATELPGLLRRAVDAQLLAPAGEPGVHEFRHALVAEALRSRLFAGEAAALSRRAAEALERAGPIAGSDGSRRWHTPDPPGDLAARLWFQAGEAHRAATILTGLARDARLQGAVATAVLLAERGLAMLEREPGYDPVATALRVVLLDALLDAGEMERAVALGSWLDVHASTGQRMAVHLRLARAASTAGRWADGLREIARLRSLDPGPQLAAEADAVEAFLTFGHPTPDRLARAEHLATRALAAEAGPEVDCAALEVLASCARTRDLAASRDLCDRALAVAEKHRMTTWRIRMLFHLGTLDGFHDVDPARLRLAHETAVAAGSVLTGLVIECELAVVHLTRGEFTEAGQLAGHAEEVASRLRLAATRLIALALRVCVAAHQGLRQQTEHLYGRYRALGGEDVDHAVAVWGLGLGFCAMLEDDLEQAWHLLDRAVTREHDLPPHYLSFNRGPHLLLATITGKAGRAEVEDVGGAHWQARWNRQFVLLSRAVLDGREGDPVAAAAAVAQFEELAAPYPVARHLGLRLIGECAHTDGWGRPREWLSAAEAYFHAAGTLRIAAACRERLRAMGVPLRQRRQGSDLIPPHLRRAGVTVREFEVLELIAERLGNREIGARLFLSPRTVEKHVASLLVKTGQPDRGALARAYPNMGGPEANMG